MNEKIDFPFPPRHYKDINKNNYLQHPNVNKLFENNSEIYIFSQKESLHDNSIKSLPNYVEECKNRFFNNQGLKAELLKLIDHLRQAMQDYFMAIIQNSENLVELNVKINDIACHIFYLFKLAKNTIGAQTELSKIYKESITDITVALQQYKEVVRETSMACREI